MGTCGDEERKAACGAFGCGSWFAIKREATSIRLNFSQEKFFVETAFLFHGSSAYAELLSELLNIV